MDNLYSSLDYRSFLRQCFEERKAQNTYYSYRLLGSKTGLDASYLVKLFQEKVHLSEKKVGAICDAFEIAGRAREYFEILVAFNKAKSQKQSQALFEKLNQFHDIQSVKLRTNQYEYYQKWYHSAVRATIGMGGFTGDFEALAKSLQPPISKTQAKHSVTLLLKLGLIQKLENGYTVTNQFLTADSKWRSMAVRGYQKDLCDLAKTALDNCPKELRDFSTLTLSLSEGDLEELAVRMADFRQSVLRMVESSKKADRVYQLNLQMFPLAFKQGGGS